MSSNTKVSTFGISKSKAHGMVASFLRFNPVSEFFQDDVTGVTVLVTLAFENANIARVSTAIMSPDENKFRKLVGLFLAVENMENGQYINVPVNRVTEVIIAMGIEYK